ncbi:DUF2283 domain-containing protein [Archaeoglobus sp.]
MKVSYDPKHDVLYLKFSDAKIVNTVEVVEGILIDYGENGEIVGIEMINASALIKTKPLKEVVIKIQE